MCLQPITELPAGSGCYLPFPAQPYTALPSAGKLRKSGKCWWEKLAEVPVKHTAKSPLRTSTELKKKVLKEENMTKPQLQSPPALNLFKFRPKVYLTRVKKKEKRLLVLLQKAGEQRKLLCWYKTAAGLLQPCCQHCSSRGKCWTTDFSENSKLWCKRGVIKSSFIISEFVFEKRSQKLC